MSCINKVGVGTICHFVDKLQQWLTDLIMASALKISRLLSRSSFSSISRGMMLFVYHLFDHWSDSFFCIYRVTKLKWLLFFLHTFWFNYCPSSLQLYVVVLNWFTGFVFIGDDGITCIDCKLRKSTGKNKQIHALCYVWPNAVGRWVGYDNFGTNKKREKMLIIFSWIFHFLVCTCRFFSLHLGHENWSCIIVILIGV